MKYLFILLLFSCNLFGQTNKDDLLFQKIESGYFSDSLVSTKKLVKQFLNENPNSPHKAEVIYYFAEAESKLGNMDNALALYKKVLKTDIPEIIYNNTKNYSCKKLVEIYISKNNFKNAVKYLGYTKKKYPYSSFCGNAYASDDIYITDLYSVCYIKQGYYKKAIDVLSPLMFNNGLADNSEIVIKLYNTYFKVYSKEEIKQQFTNAEKTLIIKEEKIKNDVFFRPIIKIFGRETYVPAISFLDYEFEISKMSQAERKQKCIKFIKESKIYELAIKE